MDAATVPDSARDDIEHASARRSESWLDTASAPRFAVPILLITGLALLVLNLGGYPLYTKGEPREAVTILDIVNGGGWILPKRAGIEIPSKPLMMHWMGAIVSLIAGRVDEWTVRMPSALLAVAGILLCYLYVRRLFDDRSAFLSALILATSFQYLQAGTGARVDMTLTFFMEVAFFEFLLIAEGLTRRRALMYLAIAAAILTKGPVGLVLPGAVAFVWIAIERRWPLLRDLRLPMGAAIVLVFAGGWYYAAARVGGDAFVRKQLLQENVLRFLGGPHFHEGHAHPFYYIELALLAGFMPWTILLPAPLVRFARSMRPLGPRLKYLLTWVFVILIFYNLARSKRGVYMLAVYPALSALLGISLASPEFAPAGTARWPRRFALAAGVCFILIGAAGFSALSRIWNDPAGFAGMLARFGITASGFVPNLAAQIAAHRAVAIAIPAAVILIGVWIASATPVIEETACAIAAGFGVIAIAANLFVVPAIARTLTLKRFATDAMKVVDGAPVAYLEGLNYDVAFYSGRTIPIVTLSDANLPPYLFCWRSTYERVAPALRNRFAVALASVPTELDGTGAMVLLRRSR
jgi:4-amino-4-deoxy-L-arabinose transferase-like glycosyltransferase